MKICEREKFQRASCVLFSQNYTEEQNTQRRTETLSQPIAQSITANDGCNVLWYIAINSVLSVVCLQTFVGSPCSQKGFCLSVKICEREKNQRAPCVLFSQNYTEEQNTQRRTETLSQPIAQSITANDGCNVLWYIAVNSVISVVCLQAFVGSPCSQKGFCSSVKICEREKFQRASCILSLTELHRRTEYTKTHRDIKSTDNTERYS